MTRVRSYPVAEAAPFVWVWTGDPAAATPPPAPRNWAVYPAPVTAAGAMEVACNYLALKENFLDLSHFAYVHAATLAVTDWDRPPTVEKTPHAVSYHQVYEASPLPAHYGVPTGIGCERAVDRHAWGSYVGPGLQLPGSTSLTATAASRCASPMRRRRSIRLGRSTGGSSRRTMATAREQSRH